jgi:hypothetical protein
MTATSGRLFHTRTRATLPALKSIGLTDTQDINEPTRLVTIKYRYLNDID